MDEGLLESAVQAALRAAIAADGERLNPGGRRASVEVSVRVTGDTEMRRLNREYRGVDRPTDVLSFSLTEGDDLAGVYTDDRPLPLGDVALSLPRARQQARELGHAVEMELAWLTVHGVLQLLGYAHDTEAAAQHMEGVEDAALRALGFRKE